MALSSRVPQEIAHISLPLVLAGSAAVCPVHLPSEATGRGNEEGELMGKGSKAARGAEPKGIIYLGESVGPSPTEGSQSRICL